MEAFETAYNAACGSIARSELRQAEVLLKRAKGAHASYNMDPRLIYLQELCKHSEDLPDEEKVAELLPITVQQLYVFERLGKVEEAKAIASELKAEE